MKAQSIWDYDKEQREDAVQYSKRLALKEFEESKGLGRYFLRARTSAGFSWAEVVVLRHGHLLVHGDCDAVIFGVCSGYEGPRGVLYWMANAGSTYAREKAHIGSSGKIATTWERDVAAWYIDEWQREAMVTAEQAEELRQALRDEECCQQAWAECVYEVTEDHELCSAGEVTAREVFMAQGVLRALIVELEAIDMRKRASEWFRRSA